jgi:hypothetical protein
MSEIKRYTHTMVLFVEMAIRQVLLKLQYRRIKAIFSLIDAETSKFRG